MTLTQLLVFGAAALLFGWVFKERWRGWLMLIGSLLALYWLQPATPIRHLDFWLPTASLALTVLVWAITRPPTTDDTRPTLITGTLITALVIAIGLTRYLGPLCCLIPTRPPDLPEVLIALVVVAALAAAVFRFAPGRRWLLALSAAAIIALFVTLKTEPFALAASAGLRALGGQSAEQASALDLRWLGFSYIAFRLLHALRDRMTGRLPPLSLQEFVTYALFFPSLTAGPIDRAERFAKDLRQPFALSVAEAMDGLTRIVAGVFKKFVLADTLAAIALNGANAAQTTSTLWMWVLLYAYAFRLYLDFGGYTDIAIGIGRLCGVRLPENFDRPYLKQNLTAFWNSWHITLAQWFRAYFFNPLTRALRSRPVPAALIIFIGQVSTMILIGLWHGVTWNFVAWGAWHAVGLFVHNRWADYSRAHPPTWDNDPRLKRAANGLGVLLTFHYVALGWVWFALPSLSLSQQVFLRLLGR
ncbi:MAG: alginate O-acetyltransferase complex protein AlgI [Anaerolineales bacterium]|nr:alginate O-acetyltransferase complex protein AlgI [Anaerolineales bacterium]